MFRSESYWVPYNNNINLKKNSCWKLILFSIAASNFVRNFNAFKFFYFKAYFCLFVVYVQWCPISTLMKFMLFFLIFWFPARYFYNFKFKFGFASFIDEPFSLYFPKLTFHERWWIGYWCEISIVFVFRILF